MPSQQKEKAENSVFFSVSVTACALPTHSEITLEYFLYSMIFLPLSNSEKLWLAEGRQNSEILRVVNVFICIWCIFSEHAVALITPFLKIFQTLHFFSKIQLQPNPFWVEKIDHLLDLGKSYMLGLLAGKKILEIFENWRLRV